MREVFVVAVLFGLFGVAAFGTPMRYEYEGTWGSYGTGDGQFASPFGVCRAANGNIYVADLTNDRVQYFTAEGSFLGKWGTPGTGNGQFDKPADVAFDAAGTTAYVTDTRNDRVQYFTVTGSYLGGWGDSGTGQGQFDRPHGIATAANGDVYVTDTFNHRVQYFSSSGSFRGLWGGHGVADGLFAYPYGIAVAPDGNIYVADSSNTRVQYFTASGSFLGKFSFTPAGTPYGVEITRDYLVYVATLASEKNVRVVSRTGSLLATIGEGGSGEGQFRTPWGVAVDPVTFRVYVSEIAMSLSRVQYFELANRAVRPVSLGRVKALFE